MFNLKDSSCNVSVMVLLLQVIIMSSNLVSWTGVSRFKRSNTDSSV